MHERRPNLKKNMFGSFWPTPPVKIKYLVFSLHRAMGAAGKQFLSTLSPSSLFLPPSVCLASQLASLSCSNHMRVILIWLWMRFSQWKYNNWVLQLLNLVSAYYCNYAMDKCIVGHAKVTASTVCGNAWGQFLYTIPPPLSSCGDRRACYSRSCDEIIPSKPGLLQRYL